MLKVEEHSDAEAFYWRTEAFLCSAEAENCLMLGIVKKLKDKWQEDARLFVVGEGDTVAMAATMTPPWQLIITRSSESAQDALVEYLVGSGIAIPGVGGEARAAKSFAESYAARNGLPIQEDTAMRIFSLDAVQLKPPAPGRFRIATEADVAVLAEWRVGFAKDAHLREVEAANEAPAKAVIVEGRQFLWDDDGPVAMACLTGETPNGRRISGVYTPPENRCKGYATSLVSALSQHLLDSGKKFCFLYTDLANPTSNSIYAKVGYEPVCDSTAFFFSKRGL